MKKFVKFGKGESKEEKRDCALVGWDLTSYNMDLTHQEIIEVLKTLAKKWAFQKEKCPTTERLHWQMRIKLFEKKRESTLINVLKGTLLIGTHVSITSNKVHQGNNFNYVMKIDRVEGPWADIDEPEEDESRDEKDKPMEVKKLDELGLWPWATEVKDNCIKQITEPDHIHINVICDIFGVSGKTWFVKWMEWYKHGCYIPGYNDMSKLVGYVATRKPRPAYLFDMPRAMSKLKLNEFWSGVENVKAGMISDWRHKAKFLNRSMPAVWIFSNMPPPNGMLTNGRIICWMIDPDSKELVEWTEKRWNRANAENDAKIEKKTELKPKRKSKWDSEDESMLGGDPQTPRPPAESVDGSAVAYKKLKRTDSKRFDLWEEYKKINEETLTDLEIMGLQEKKE